jgi:hypothetical protein
VKKCSESACTYAIEVQDVGGTTTRRILEGATAAYGLEWSPDRRNLIAVVTIGGHWGSYLVSALGGTPRLLTSGAATFYGGGDSLLVGPSYRPDSVFWVRVTSLDGATRDSIRVAGAGQALAGLTVVPGTRWIVALVVQGSHGLWQVMDRSGRVADHVINSCTCAGRASTDALWLERSGGASGAGIVRVGLDQASGRLASRQDTLFTGVFTGFSVTADGASLVLDEGTYEYGLWALELGDALRGKFPENRRLVRSSTQVSAAVSPDGKRLLVRRVLPTSAGKSEARLSIMPFEGGSEVPLGGAGAPIGSGWVDSVTVATATQTPRGLHLARVDLRTGAERGALDLPDSLVFDFVPLPDGWAWIPPGGGRLVVRQGGRTRQIPKPDWFNLLTTVSASPDGRIVYTGWNASTFDTLRIDVLSPDGGNATRWAAFFAETGSGYFLSDGSVLFTVFGTEESVTLYRVTGPGRVERLGTVPRPVAAITVSKDGRRATVLARDYHGDAWLSKLAKP